MPGIDSDIPKEDITAASPLPAGNSEVPMGDNFASKKSEVDASGG